MTPWRWFMSWFQPSYAAKHFGYVGTLDSQASLVATAPFTNFAFGGFPDRATLALAKAQNVKPYVNVGPILFHDVGTVRVLYPDAEQRLAAWRRTNGVDAFLTQIMAFYVVDEPTWRGVSPSDLEKAVNLVKGAFPTTPITFSESHMALDTLVVPHATDWIGFAVYGIKDVFTDPTFRAYFYKLLSKRSRPDQRVILVVDGWWNPAIHNFPASEMGFVADSYWKFAQAHPEVITLAVWLWNNPFSPPILTSVDMPAAVQVHRQIGKAVTGK